MMIVMLLQTAACSSSGTPDVTSGNEESNVMSDAAQQETESTAETTADIRPDLPEIKRGGEEFKFFAEGYITDIAKRFYNVYEETGHVVNDAAYKRNRAIEEQFDIKLSYIEGIREQFAKKLIELYDKVAEADASSQK